MRSIKPIPTPKAVLFDFDGTLAPNLDLPDMRRQVIALTQSQGVPSEVYQDRYIVEIIDAGCQWLRDTGRNQEGQEDTVTSYFNAAHQLIKDIELEAAAQTSLFPETEIMLTQLKSRDIKLGIVTRNCREAVRQVFPNVLAHVDVLLARNDATYLKPDPRHLLDSLALLNTTPDDAINGWRCRTRHAGGSRTWHVLHRCFIRKC